MELPVYLVNLNPPAGHLYKRRVLFPFYYACFTARALLRSIWKKKLRLSYYKKKNRKKRAQEKQQIKRSLKYAHSSFTIQLIVKILV